MGRLADIIFGKPGDTPQPKAVDDWDSEQPSDPVHPGLPDTNAPDKQDPYHAVDGHKIVPEVIIDRLEPHLSSDFKQIELWADLCNNSDFEVEVTKVTVLKQTNDVCRYLKPHEKHEIRIYRGEVPQNDAEHKAQIQYKIVGNGDYFMSEHQLMYRYERNAEHEMYIPEELRLLPPIRDM